MNPILSWAIVLLLGGGAYFYYQRNGTRGRPRGRTLQRAADAVKAKDEQWGVSETASKVAKKAPKAKAARKSVKKAVQEVGDKVETALSAVSSTVGVDADDDSSQATSPALGAISNKIPSGKDVSDMLEPKGAAPNVLRLTGSSQSAKKQKQQPAPAPQETKKQRQNRKKAEDAKAQREADEKQRQALLEQQRRTAREARGEPAKNGLKPAKAPATSAWNNVPSNGNVHGAKQSVGPAQDGQFLDTFDPEVDSTASSSEHPPNGTSSATEWAGLPTEEEQVRMAMEDSAWTTVPKGKKAKKINKVNDVDEPAVELASEPKVSQPPVKKAPAPKENAKPQTIYEIMGQDAPALASHIGHPQDSDWPVV